MLDPASGRPVANPALDAQQSAVAATSCRQSHRPAAADLAGHRQWHDDWRPILGEVPTVPGFFIGMFPWMGFTAGPMSARLVADAVLGQKAAESICAVFPLTVLYFSLQS